MDSRQLSRWPLWIARTTAVLVFFTGVTVLLGWTFDVIALKSVLSGWTKMAPVTALCFGLAGMALWGASNGNIRQRQQPESVWHRFSQIGAAVIVLIGLFRLSAYFSIGTRALTTFSLANRQPFQILPKCRRRLRLILVWLALPCCWLAPAGSKHFSFSFSWAVW